MKAGTALGSVFTTAGALTAAAGLCSALMPDAVQAGVKSALNALQIPAENVLYTASDWVMQHGWLVCMAGAGAVLLGVILLACSAHAARKRARRAAEERKNRLMELREHSAPEHSAPPSGFNGPPVPHVEEDTYRNPFMPGRSVSPAHYQRLEPPVQPSAHYQRPEPPVQPSAPYQKPEPPVSYQPPVSTTPAVAPNPYVRPIEKEILWAQGERQESAANPFARQDGNGWATTLFSVAHSAEKPVEEIQFYPPEMDDEPEESAEKPFEVWSPSLNMIQPQSEPEISSESVWGARYALPTEPEPSVMTESEPVYAAPQETVSLKAAEKEDLEAIYTPNEIPASELMQPASSRIRLTIGKKSGM